MNKQSFKRRNLVYLQYSCGFKKDNLKKFRKQFHIPKVNGKDAIYFTGNSFGLQPKSTKKILNQEFTDWAELGVENLVDVASCSVNRYSLEKVCCVKHSVNIVYLFSSLITHSGHSLLCTVS